MGVLNRLFGGANGVREAMRLSYANHVGGIASGKIAVSDPSEAHYFGLYGALSTRYRARGVPRSEASLMIELAPFCAMPDKNAAVAMLAEYVVYQELPADAQLGVLRTVLNTTAENIWDGPWLDGTVAGIEMGAQWVPLLEADTIYVLRARAAALSTAAPDGNMIIVCPKCTQKLRVRTGPNLVATCPKCRTEIDLESRPQ